MKHEIITFTNDELKQFFFSTSHTQSLYGLGPDWVPCTYRLVSGKVTNKEEYKFIFCQGYEEIRNPDVEFDPEVQAIAEANIRLAGEQPSYDSLWNWK